MPPADFRTCLDRSRDKGELPLVMGIVNVTPDSFSGDGRLSPDHIRAHACRLIDAGAEALDIGAESTRPGSLAVPESVERERLLPALDALADLDIPLSIDTRRPSLFKEALSFGATLLNDIGGLCDPGFLAILRENPRIMAVLMHAQGSPDIMQKDPRYDDVVATVETFFREGLDRIEENDIPRDRVILDPGIGFGKTREHNLALLRESDRFASLGTLMVAPSRKRFLDSTGEDRPPADRDIATGAVMAWSLLHGASLFRTHRPEIAREVRSTLLAIVGNSHG
ncbi:MAG: dihydropteroate synthase [Leptospirales bacterium]